MKRRRIAPVWPPLFGPYAVYLVGPACVVSLLLWAVILEFGGWRAAAVLIGFGCSLVVGTAAALNDWAQEYLPKMSVVGRRRRSRKHL